MKLGDLTRAYRKIEDAVFGFRRSQLRYAQDASQINRLDLEQSQIRLVRAREDLANVDIEAVARERQVQDLDLATLQERIAIAQEELTNAQQRGNAYFSLNHKLLPLETAELNLMTARDTISEAAAAYDELAAHSIEVFFDAFGQIKTRFVESIRDGITAAERLLAEFAAKNKSPDISSRVNRSRPGFQTPTDPSGNALPYNADTFEFFEYQPGFEAVRDILTTASSSNNGGDTVFNIKVEGDVITDSLDNASRAIVRTVNDNRSKVV